MNDTFVFIMLLNSAASSVISPSTGNIKYKFELLEGIDKCLPAGHKKTYSICISVYRGLQE